jgi:ubiquinone/menaquinone biosynthesis C-methylase UbiE
MTEEARAWELWDRPGIAQEIDRLWHFDEEAIYRLTVSYYLSKYILKKDRVLEVGCGNGFFYNYLKKFADMDYTGIDTSNEMLVMAGLAHPGITFKKGDGYHIDAPDDSFDAVFAIDVLIHLPDIVTMIREMKRVSRRIVAFTLLISPQTVHGAEKILDQTFIHNRYSMRDALAQVNEATGGTPHYKFDTKYNGSFVWIVAKSTTLDLGPGYSQGEDPMRWGA